MVTKKDDERGIQIQISLRVWKYLNSIKKSPSETFDSVLIKLLKLENDNI